jgi:hypothetical protein
MGKTGGNFMTTSKRSYIIETQQNAADSSQGEHNARAYCLDHKPYVWHCSLVLDSRRLSADLY